MALYAGWPMYGVVCSTPPRRAAATDATPSVNRIVRVSNSSPAAAALSVQSMPPTIVANANGTAMGSFSRAAAVTISHQAGSTTDHTEKRAGGAQAALDAAGATSGTMLPGASQLHSQ